MNLTFTLFCPLIVAGCATPPTPNLLPQGNIPPSERASNPSKEPLPFGQKEATPADLALTQNFLDALFRPKHTVFRIVADASSESSNSRIEDTNKILEKRIAMLRNLAEKPVLSIWIDSGDSPLPYGSGIVVFDYFTDSGTLVRRGPHLDMKNLGEILIDIRHWPNGTRLVNVSASVFDDFKVNIFHLRQKEEIFRFAIAIEPLD